jgi:hypothetical protein
MTDKEMALFEAVTNCASNYLEFGSGGSTVLATTTVSSRVISINSSQQWLDSVRANATSAPGDRLILHYVDIGPTGDWGAPTDNNNATNGLRTPWTYGALTARNSQMCFSLMDDLGSAASLNH